MRPTSFRFLHLLHRWVASPQGIRWLVGCIVASVVMLAIAWVLLVPAADWLASHDVGQVTGPLRTLRLQTARDAARGRLLTLAAGVFAVGALMFTAGNFNLSRRTLELTQQGQVTDRYTKAIEQLGSSTIDVSLGGIYALERIARDSSRDHPTGPKIRPQAGRRQRPAARQRRRALGNGEVI
jgi:hypothetical protein